MLKRFGNHIKWSLIVAVAVVGFSACSSENTLEDTLGVNPDAPVLPSTSTMLMDVSFFGVTGSESAAQMDVEGMQASAAAGNRSNWIQAVVRVVFLQLTFWDAFEEPIGAFAYAIHSIPQEQPDGSYLWTYIFVEEGVDYGVFLYGKVVGNTVEWRLEVSSNSPELPLDHFVWFDGVVQQDDSAASWQFYGPVLDGASPTSGVPVVRMDHTDNGAGTTTLTVANNEVAGEEEGDVITIVDAPGMSTIDYHDADVMEDHNITWRVDGSGSIMVPDYNAGVMSCWSTEQKDIACP